MKSYFPLINPVLVPHSLRAVALAVLLASSPVLAEETAADAAADPAAATPGTSSIQTEESGGMMAPVNEAFDSVTDFFSFGSDDDAAEAEAEDAAPAQPIPVDQPHRVGDLAYGDLLFEYYQQHYFAAITKILVAQERGLLSRDSEHTQVLLGSLYVSYGLLDKGEAIFRQMLTRDNITAEGADEAWYQLARIHYKSGDVARARDILVTEIKIPLEERATEHTLLLALCHIRLGEADLAKPLLPYLKDDPSLGTFTRFNLGSAFAQMNQLNRAGRYFTQVAETEATDEASLVLKDQATLALGVKLLKQNKTLEARELLEGIRLYGPVANRGLLALGWTYFNSSDQAGALTPWLELAERDLADPAVQEALLNIPYVYEQQGALQDALDRYREAHQIFEQQRNNLDQVKLEIQQPDWVEKISPVSKEDTREVMGNIPPFELDPEDPASRHLYLYFSSNEFQKIYRDYRELQRLYMVLVHWKRQLPSYNQMVATHVGRLEKLGPKSDKAIAYSRKFHAYASVKLDEFNARLNQMLTNDDLMGSANVQQMTQKERLDSVEATLKSLGEPEMYEEEWAKLRMLKGLLMWDLNATALNRRWEMTKDSIAIENQLIELEQRIRAVEQARTQRVDRFHGFEGRIAELDQRMTTLQGEIAAALRNNRLYLQNVATGIVEQNQTQLDRMRAKALLSIARLQDRGYVQERERQSLQYRQGQPAAEPAAGQPASESATPESTPQSTPDARPERPGRNGEPDNLRDAVRDIFSE